MGALLKRLVWAPVAGAIFFCKFVRNSLLFVICALALVLTPLILLNLIFHTPFNVAFRALDPNSGVCQTSGDGWDILADKNIGNDEWNAVDHVGRPDDTTDWEMRFHCSIQKHAIPNYRPPASPGNPPAAPQNLSYNLAFLEFQESGDPYLLCNEKEYGDKQCDGGLNSSDREVRERRGQIEALLAKLQANEDAHIKNFVVAFVHGWRHNAQIGDGNVEDLRVYAAHAARFVKDRCGWGDKRFCDMEVTAVYIGWRGARTDENRMQRTFAPLTKRLCSTKPDERSATAGSPMQPRAPETCWFANLIGDIGTVAASITLFDRKPVSEAVAPSALAALGAIENQIHLQKALRETDLAPCEHDALVQGNFPSTPDYCLASSAAGYAHQSRMIVFGHSLGGNILATALQYQLVKYVEEHKPGHHVVKAGDVPAHDEDGDFIPSPLGNLVVLINPAAEAAKWLGVQRAVWDRIAMAYSDKNHGGAYTNSHLFFRDDQRPVVISVTAARDWPPGGLRPIDCAIFEKQIHDVELRAGETGADPATKELAAKLDYEKKRLAHAVDYDWATHDLFPAFRFDFRPAADSLENYAGRLARGPEGDPCTPYKFNKFWPLVWHGVASAIRVMPFMNTDIEQSHTIGNLDPSRAPEGNSGHGYFSPRPFGTTHELRGWDDKVSAARNTKTIEGTSQTQEASVPYADIVTDVASCRRATGWLTQVRETKIAAANSGKRATFWDAIDLPKDKQPALRFEHGFDLASIAAITRANDPFWNMRALDNALAEHDGYMLTSFICAMYQLVLDDVTVTSPAKPNPAHPE